MTVGREEAERLARVVVGEPIQRPTPTPEEQETARMVADECMASYRAFVATVEAERGER